jgi:hypothetical protein
MVDFSVMTSEMYLRIQNIRKKINDGKKRLSLLSVDMGSKEDTDNIDEFNSIKQKFEKLSQTMNSLDSVLKKFEI